MLSIALTSSAAYALTYFWRYPVFMLPPSYSETHVVTLFGTPLDLQVSLSIAFTLGFACAKPAAITLLTSQFFFENRLKVVLSVITISAAVEGFGVWIFGGVPSLQVLCVFISSFLSSSLFGAIITYLEGRQTTEALLAMNTGFFIFAGNLSRGTAQLLLDSNCPPLIMPLVVASFTCPPCCALVVFMDRQPRPSRADEAARSKRSAMTREQKIKFLVDWWPAIITLLPSYALIMGIRSFRDLFTAPLFAASVDATKAPAALFFAADLPGAVVSVFALLFFATVRDNAHALNVMLLSIIGGMLFAFGSTILFLAPCIGGFAWQLLLGAGLFLSFSVLSTPLYERMFAAGRVEGTISFLVLSSDLSGYIVTLGIFAYSVFGNNEPVDDDESQAEDDDENDRRYNKLVLHEFLQVLWGCGISATFLAVVALVYLWWRLRGVVISPSKNLQQETDQEDTISVPASLESENSSRISSSDQGEGEGLIENDEDALPSSEKNGAYTIVSPLVDDSPSDETGNEKAE